MGGAAQVAERLAAELGPLIQLGAPVGAIEQNGGGVRVTFGEGDQITAAAAVVAIPPPLRLGIRFSPALPPEWQGLLQRFWPIQSSVLHGHRSQRIGTNRSRQQRQQSIHLLPIAAFIEADAKPLRLG